MKLLPILAWFSFAALLSLPAQQIEISAQLRGFDLPKVGGGIFGEKSGNLPRVTTRDQLPVSIMNAREYIYPVTFSSQGKPGDWQTSNLGVVLEVTPHIEGQNIRLNGSVHLADAPHLRHLIRNPEMVPVLSSTKHFTRVAQDGEPVIVDTLTPAGKKASLTITPRLVDAKGQSVRPK